MGCEGRSLDLQSFPRATPCQSLFGRLCRGKVLFFLDRAFADLILELANNAWHGAEDLGQGKIQQTWIFLISDGQGVVRTKAVGSCPVRFL